MLDLIKDTVFDGLTRRDIIKAGAMGAAAGALAPVVAQPAQAATLAMPKVGSFKIAFRNQHTGESFSGVYRVGDRYLPEAFDKINHVLRDFRVNEVFPMDPRTIDILYMVHQKSGSSAPFEVLSGYRSQKTNAMLRRASTGVAKNSLHMVGQAIDFRLPGFSTKNLRNIAISLRAGGVGYYPGSNFVHVDTGKVRSW